jgi:hypothetical protein
MIGIRKHEMKTIERMVFEIVIAKSGLRRWQLLVVG